MSEGAGIGSTIELAAGTGSRSDFSVLSFSGREEMSRHYRFDVHVVSLADLAPSSLVGQRARLTIQGVVPRFVHGLVSRTTLGTPLPDGAQTFTVTLRPRLALLGRRKTSRVFQDLTVPEIVQKVAGELSVEAELQLGRDYKKRPYCVQYQETDLSFVRRLLAEEGLFHFFRHPPPADLGSAPERDGREVWVVADAPSHYVPIEGDKRLALRDVAFERHDEAVHALHRTDRIREGGVLARGFDYEKPKFVPVAETKVVARGPGVDVSALRAYEHDRVLEDKTVEPHVARVALESFRRSATFASGEGDCRRLLPGATFELGGHPDKAQDGEYVVVSVEHQGRELGGAGGGAAGNQRVYHNTFRCVPASVPFRPKRKPRRLMQVTETATVVGPRGEEIHTDEMGRIKIQFHWDLEGKHDDHSSCWIRVMQPWAGQAWGAQFIPRVGMEVVVTFTGGDTDRPMVIGCVYNGATPTPFKLPDEKTKSGLRTRSSPGGKGFNELSFDDQAGTERVYLHAERDFDQVVEHDYTRRVHGHEAIKVTENRLVEVEQDNVRLVRGSETILIEKNLILHVAGHKLFQIGSPPESAEDDRRSRELVEDPSVYASFEALASLPLFEDAGAARASQKRRANILFQAERLEGDDYRAGQLLVGRVSDYDNRLDGLAGSAHILTQDMRAIPERIREAAPGSDPVGSALSRAQDILDRAEDLDGRMAETLDDCSTSAPPIAGLQKAVAAHIGQKRERLRLIADRARGCQKLLGDVPAFLAGFREGGGGGGAWESYVDSADGKTKGKLPEEVKGSVMKILGPGHIDASAGFKITCGNSSIELTPGSIKIDAKGPVKINGQDIELNC